MNVKLTSSVHTTHDGPTLAREGLAPMARERISRAQGCSDLSLRRADRGVSQPQQ